MLRCGLQLATDAAASSDGWRKHRIGAGWSTASAVQLQGSF